MTASEVISHGSINCKSIGLKYFMVNRTGDSDEISLTVLSIFEMGNMENRILIETTFS